MLSQGHFRTVVLVCLVLIGVLLSLNLINMTSQSVTKTPLPKAGSSETNASTGTMETEEPAYNKDLQNIRRNGLSQILQGIDLSKLSADQILQTIHSYLDNTNVLCRRKLRMGNLGDGGWEICDDPDVRPRPPCIIYSFGISYDFSFDDDAARVYGCHVFSFDPSMTKYQDSVERSKLVHFYKIGLSNKNTTNSANWKLATFANIRSMLGHQNRDIDIVKMDIESSEWESIPEMIKSGQLQTVKQLMVEYHILNDNQLYLLPRLQTIQNVENSGFLRYYVHKNPACGRNIPGAPVVRTSCYEIHYIRRS